MTASEILARLGGELPYFKRLMSSEDDKVVLQTLMFLVSMRDGKPAQRINVTSTTLTLNQNDLERARAIVREIRGETPQPSIMLLGDGEGKREEVEG